MKGHFTPHSEETKKKISLAKLGKPSPRKGVKLSNETIQKIIETKKKNAKPHWNKGGKAPWAVGNKYSLGRVAWNKGSKGVMPSPWNKGKKLSEEIRKKLSISHIGQKSWNKGKKGSIAWNKGMKGYQSGENHYNWKGGITPLHNKIRESLEYKLWQDCILSRD